MKNTIIVLGNGFDLAHYYRTKYSDFLEDDSTSPKILQYQELVNKIFPTMEKDSWSSFENTIQILTREILACREEFPTLEELGCSSWSELLCKTNCAFDELTIGLTDYLTKVELENKQYSLFQIKSLKKFFNKQAIVINFNFSGIADRYGVPMFHPHGTTKERNIILGYDNCGDRWGKSIDEPDVMEWDLMIRKKEVLRDQLEYRNKLKKMNFSAEEIDFNMQEFIDYQKALYCGGGPYEGHLSANPDQVPNIEKELELARIERIVIVGHSLESDIRYLSALFDYCVHLKEFVVYYRTKTEKKEKLNVLKQWFTKSCIKASKVKVIFWHYTSRKKDKRRTVLNKEKRG